MQQIFAEYMDKGNYSLLNCHRRYEVVGLCIWPLMSGSFQLKKKMPEKSTCGYGMHSHGALSSLGVSCRKL